MAAVLIPFVSLALALLPQAQAQAPLRFRADGTFKAVEVSDTHFTNNPRCTDISKSQQRYPCSDKNATEFWAKLIQQEDPDLFICAFSERGSGTLLAMAMYTCSHCTRARAHTHTHSYWRRNLLRRHFGWRQCH
jgi:hypothetical protein